MTEAQWLAGTDPQAMLRRLMTGRADESMGANYPLRPCPIRPSDRKLRLFCVACCRLWPVITHVEDSWEERGIARHAHEWARNWASKAAGGVPQATKAALLSEIFGNPFQPVTIRSWQYSTCKVCGASPNSEGEIWHGRGCYRISEDGGGLEWAEEITPAWLTWNDGTIPKLAQTIYQERRFGEVSVLADALEEAGCENEEILRHLRRPVECQRCRSSGKIEVVVCGWCEQGDYHTHCDDTWRDTVNCPECKGAGRSPHVRGCWAVDLLLGQE